MAKHPLPQTQTPPPANTLAPRPTPAQPPAVIAPGGPVIPAAAQAFLSEAVGAETTPAKPGIIKINHREGRFVLPTGELADSVEGYLIHQFRTRKWWKQAYKAGSAGSPPDCWSADGVHAHPSSVDPQGGPDHLCAGCPMNVFGTGRDGRSKACAEPTWLFLYNNDFGNPPVAVLLASTSSLGVLYGGRMSGGYLDQCKKKHGAFQIVWTRFGLEQKGDPGGVEYSVLRPEMLGALTDMEQVKALAQFHNRIKAVLDEYRLRTPQEQEG